MANDGRIRYLVLFICSTTFCTTLAIEQSPRMLDFGSGLSVFDHCVVHIARNDLNKKSAKELAGISGKAVEEYDLMPLDFPFVLSTRIFFVSQAYDRLVGYYPSSERGRWDRGRGREGGERGRNCNGRRAYTVSGSGKFKFRAPPSHKINCAVQLYIDPIDCTTWKIPENYPVVPGTFFDTVFDYRIDSSIGTASKSRWFLIHVEWNIDHHPVSLPTDFFFQLEYQFSGNIHGGIGTFASKILVQLEYLEGDRVYLVARTYLVSLHLSFHMYDNQQRIKCREDGMIKQYEEYQSPYWLTKT